MIENDNCFVFSDRPAYSFEKHRQQSWQSISNPSSDFTLQLISRNHVRHGVNNYQTLRLIVYVVLNDIQEIFCRQYSIVG